MKLITIKLSQKSRSKILRRRKQTHSMTKTAPFPSQTVSIQGLVPKIQTRSVVNKKENKYSVDSKWLSSLEYRQFHNNYQIIPSYQLKHVLLNREIVNNKYYKIKYPKECNILSIGNIVLTDKVDFINNLQPKEFTWKSWSAGVTEDGDEIFTEAGENYVFGFLAQDMENHIDSLADSMLSHPTSNDSNISINRSRSSSSRRGDRSRRGGSRNGASKYRSSSRNAARRTSIDNSTSFEKVHSAPPKPIKITKKDR